MKRLHPAWFQPYDILEKAKLRREHRDQWLPGVGRKGRAEEAKHRGLSGEWNYSVWSCGSGYTALEICPNSKNARHTKSEPKANCALWMIMMWRLTDCNTCASLVGVLLMGEVIHVWVLPRGIKNLPANRADIEMQVWSLGQENPLEEGMATYSSILAWRIPRTEEPGSYSPWGCKELDTTQVT